MPRTLTLLIENLFRHCGGRVQPSAICDSYDPIGTSWSTFDRASGTSAAPDTESGRADEAQLWTEAGQQALRDLPMEGWAARHRQDSLQLLVPLNEMIREMDQAVSAAALNNAQARLLMILPKLSSQRDAH